MIAKSLFAASAMAAGLLAVQPNAAEAKANVDINVYLPGMGGYDPGYPGSGYGYFGYAPVKMSCFQGRQSLRWKGFKQIKTLDCAGKFYGYTARKNGKLYKVQLNSFSGRVVSIKKL